MSQRPHQLMMNRSILCLWLVSIAGCSSTPSPDWPMWRYDAQRSAWAPHELPAELHLLWERAYTPRTMVWDDPLNQDIMPYDRVFEPVVMGKHLFLAFNDCDKVAALDTESGEEQWAFYTDGPVRFPPVAHDGKVYFSSDDGYLYCVKARNGRLLWKFRGGPSDRKVLGNERVISSWPARGGPVLQDGIVYFAASIWPFMGTFIYALDAESGDIVWVNDGNGARYMMQPHNAPSFAGVAPQGALAVAGDKLLVPGGRSVPAVFDRNTGEFLYYQLSTSGKTGGSFVCTDGAVFFNHHREREVNVYGLADGKPLKMKIGRWPVVRSDAWYASGKTIATYDAERVRKNPEHWEQYRLWEEPVDATGDLIRSGSRLYAAGAQGITALELSDSLTQPAVAWTIPVQGSVERLISADHKLFAVTLDGRILAYGAGEGEPAFLPLQKTPQPPSESAVRTARTIVESTGVTEGYALVWGAADYDLIAALLDQTGIHITAVNPDAGRVDKLRRRFDAVGLYGTRVAIHHGTPGDYQSPSYLAALTIVSDPPASWSGEEMLRPLLDSVRPYGGKLWVQAAPDRKAQFLQDVQNLGMAGLAVTHDVSTGLVTREGALPGAGVWTHQYGDIANTTKSDDDRVRLPLGLLWFGGSSNLDVLPRHGHGPPEQVIGGRLFIEGMDALSARDVYTGRVLWTTPLDSLDNEGVYFDDTYADAPTLVTYNQIHIPGANARGANFVATEEYVYVVHGSGCTVLDAATGRRLRELTLPADAKGETPEWGYIGVSGDYLIAGADFVTYSDLIPKDKIWQSTVAGLEQKKRVFTEVDRTASRDLVVMNRHTGDVLWKHHSKYGLLHNAIIVGGSTLYSLDRIPLHIEDQFRRRARALPKDYTLRALDLASGAVRWERKKDVFGTWLSYSDEQDVLVQAYRPSRDMIAGEKGTRLNALRGADGTMLWDRTEQYSTFPILHGDKIITEGRMFSLMSGEPLQEINPITGESVNWSWKREYGCNYPIASEHLVTFRSGAAGYYDLANRSGTGNFGGFKSGCTSNLVAADGVLNAPEYTRTCQCAYQNQTSLAMIHMPEIESWTFSTLPMDGKPVKRLGINLGAPGDRVADNGTLWLEYPVVGGPSPEIAITSEPESPVWFRHHASRLAGDPDAWIGASGAVGLNRLTVTLRPDASDTKPYTVRLFFAEPEKDKSITRVFDIVLQDMPVLETFDVRKASSKTGGTVVKEFRNILVGKELTVTLQANSGSAPPVLCGLEVVAVE